MFFIANILLNVVFIANLMQCYRISNKIYPHGRIERKWQKYWLENKIFEIKNDASTSKPKYYCLGMIPYPSGHMIGYTGLDIVARYKRMRGYDVLNPIGWDSFGLPAERFAEKVGRPVEDVVRENIDNFKRQLHLMGYSYDWSKTINTSDPNYYKWTQWTFLQMFYKGLAKRVSCLVNYCPQLGTVLSNEEIINGLSERGGFEVFRKKIPHWIIKITNYSDWLYENLSQLTDWPSKVINAQRNWIGKVKGYLIPFKIDGIDIKLQAFTPNISDVIRCDRIYISVDFDYIDKLVTSEHSLKINNLINNCKTLSNIERMKLNKVVFTGTHAINPITNASIPIYVNPNVLLDISSADDIDMNLTDNCKMHLNDKVSEPTTAHNLDENKFISYTKYLMHDWIFSRQRNWGEPIPLFNINDQYKPVDNLPYVADKPSETMPQWAGSSFHFVRFLDPTNHDFLVSKALSDKWLPVDLYIGGSEHAISHLLYSRFWYKFLYDINAVPNEIPFKKVCLHGMLHTHQFTQTVNNQEIEIDSKDVVHHKGKFYVKDHTGNLDYSKIITAKSVKMSKSKGNVISPDELINEYGTDVLRLHLMFLGPFDQDKIWKLEGIIGMQRLVNRIYNLVVKNGKMNNKIVDMAVNKCYARETNRLIDGVTKDIENLKFNKSPALFSSFLNFISKYTSGRIRDETTPHDFTLIPLICIKILIKLLNPFCPHLAEELWCIINNQSNKCIKSLSFEEWPSEI